jgi:hypothetical protein
MIIKNDPPTSGNIYLPSQDIIQKALAYARGLFRDPDFKEFPREQRLEICHPNQLYVARKDIGRMGVLVAWQATPEQDWALNKHGLEYSYGAQGQHKIVAGIVLLSANYNDVINVAPVQTVILNLQNIPPRNGRWGPYWWVNKDFRFAPPRSGPGGPHIAGPDEAF